MVVDVAIRSAEGALLPEGKNIPKMDVGALAPGVYLLEIRGGGVRRSVMYRFGKL